ncbi:MAG: metal-dependent hydrolase [Candidatus Heimdallarchaeaceae archaeon]|jgi:membrane-bound metal-dependent hydrolase YbcI (DUF457 family)
MPFTPLHFGFGLFLYSVLLFLDPIALLLGTIMIDIEPIVYIIFGAGSLHGIFHSMLGVFVLLLPTTLISWGCHKLFKLEKYLGNFNWIIALISSFLGLFSHVFFDSIIYPEMMLFYPFSKETGFLFNLWSIEIDYYILGVMFCIGALILLLRFLIKRYRKKEKEQSQEEIQNKA